MVKKTKKSFFHFLSNLIYAPLFIILAPVILVCTFLFRSIKRVIRLIKWFLLPKGKKKDLRYLRKTNIDELSGEEFEDYIALLLKYLNYSSIEQTQHSNDYGVDLLAIKENISYAIQCKRYQKPVGIKAVQEIIAGKSYYGCDNAIVITNHTFTSQAKELANMSDVSLYDGLWIEETLKSIY